MGEPHSGAVIAAAFAASAAAGAASGPVVETIADVLPQLGLHWPSMVAGLLGVIIVQTLMPVAEMTMRRLFWVCIGSALLASVGTAVAAPFALHALSYVPGIDPVPARAAVAATLGGFAQKIVLWVKGKVTDKTAPAAASVKQEGGQ